MIGKIAKIDWSKVEPGDILWVCYPEELYIPGATRERVEFLKYVPGDDDLVDGVRCRLESGEEDELNAEILMKESPLPGKPGWHSLAIC